MKTKVDPKQITNFQRTDEELQSFMLFAIAVAGKKALTTAQKINYVLNGKELNETPFDYLKRIPLNHHLRVWKIGQYNRIYSAIKGVMELNLRTCSLDDLMKVRGIGPKTANFFLLHSRPNYRGAVLDTHILRWMWEVHGVRTPKSTPQGKSYNKFAALAEELIGRSFPSLSLADADLLIWKMMSGNNE
jgi:thermostable 8-oxoguanine DNA glycosylase